MTPAFWLQNLLFYCLQLCLVVLAGGALGAFIRLRSPKVELGYCHALLALCLLLPFLQPKQALTFERSGAIAAVVNQGESQDSRQDSGIFFFASIPLAAWILIGGVVLRVGWLGLGIVRLARYRKDSQPLPELRFVSGLHEQLGTRADLRLSAEIRGPVTFGWIRPAVLLPQGFLDLDLELQRAILCHELVHVARHDWFMTVIEESIRTLLWFHPAIWWLIGRIHLLREQVVDCEVIRLTEARAAYLRALLATAGHQVQPDLAPASLFLRKRHLDQRVTAVLRKEIPMSRTRSIASLSTMSAVVATAVWLASSTFPLQAVPQEANYGAIPVGSVYNPDRWRGVIEQGGDNLLREPQIMYSMDAIDRRIEGRVVVDVSIDEDGRVYDAFVVSGPPELRRDALQSALKWQYSKDIPLPAKRLVTIRFELPRDDGTFPSGAAPVTPPKRIRVGSVVQHARLEQSVTPQYPALARQARVQGAVDLKIVINTRGGVALVDVLSGHPLLIPAAVEAVKQWEYQPTLLNGLPIEVETTVSVTFSLGNGVTAGATGANVTPVTP